MPTYLVVSLNSPAQGCPGRVWGNEGENCLGQSLIHKCLLNTYWMADTALGLKGVYKNVKISVLMELTVCWKGTYLCFVSYVR